MFGNVEFSEHGSLSLFSIRKHWRTRMDLRLWYCRVKMYQYF